MSENSKAVGRRLAEARVRAGYSTQQAFADALKSSKPTVAKYEQGAREVPITVLQFLASQHGIDIGWVITGIGDVIADPSKALAPAVQVEPHLLRRLHRAARLVYISSGQSLPDDDVVAIEAANLYNALLSKVTDIRDERVVDAIIPLLVDDLAARLALAKSEPGTGKRSA